MIEDGSFWEHWGEQGKRIQAVLRNGDNDFEKMDAWLNYLQNHVKLPCPVIYKGKSSAELKHGTEIQLNDILDSDDLYGVIGSGKISRRTYQFALSEVDTIETTPDNQALHDYLMWFTNR